MPLRGDFATNIHTVMSAGKGIPLRKTPINEMKPNKPIIITCSVMALKKAWFSDITNTQNFDIYL